MKTLLQINLCVNCLSTGKIAEDIGKAAINAGWKSYVAGAIIGQNPSESEVIKIGSSNYIYLPYFESLIFDNHCMGRASRNATHHLIAEIERIKPDVIQLHTIHAYYLNLKVLFEYFASIDTPIVWTLHDCWSFTGHCAHFDSVGCDKWKTHCESCPQLKEYPKSLGLIDNSSHNFNLKKKLFTALGDRLTLVPVSEWLADLVRDSYFKNRNIVTINNGIDLLKFKPTYKGFTEKFKFGNKHIILGVASSWGEHKGLGDFFKLDEIIDHEKFQIVLVGLKEKQVATLPKSIIGITATENIEQLSELYTIATVFVNPTYQDTYPTVNLESMACGTPVITYNTGGSPESVGVGVGIVVDKGDIIGLKKAVEHFASISKTPIQQECRAKAVEFFDKQKNFLKYISLYEELAN